MRFIIIMIIIMIMIIIIINNNISVDRWFDYFKALLDKYIDTYSGGFVRDEDGLEMIISIVPFQKKKCYLRWETWSVVMPQGLMELLVNY